MSADARVLLVVLGVAGLAGLINGASMAFGFLAVVSLGAAFYWRRR